MAEVKRKRISETRYNKLLQMPKGRQYGAMINECPMTLRCLKIIDCKPIEEGGKYFIEYTVG